MVVSPLPSTAVYVPGRRGRHTNGNGVYQNLNLFFRSERVRDLKDWVTCAFTLPWKYLNLALDRCGHLQHLVSYVYLGRVPMSVLECTDGRRKPHMQG